MDTTKFNEFKESCKVKGGVLLTKNSVSLNTISKFKFKCKEGHTWETTYHSVLKGTWCEKCRRVEMLEKKRVNKVDEILNELQKILKERKGELLQGDYVNQLSKFKFKCKEGHIFETRPDTMISRGSWCDRCSRKEKLERERLINWNKVKSELIEVVKKNKGQIIQGEYINIKSKFKFKCKEGHIWETTPYVVIKGHWCGKCSNKIVIDKQRGDMTPVLKLLKENKGKFVSGEYLNQHSKLEVECEKGHRWKVTPNSLLSKKTWCRECLGTKKRNIDEMRIIGEERGGKCLSLEYVNDFSKLEWECCEGHKFWTSPNNIKHGKWCPVCSTGIYERICRLYFERIFNKPFLRVRPDWLKNPKTNSNLEIDGFNEELKLGFEHHGEQHYTENSFFRKNNTIENDKLKKVLLKKSGIKLIEIPELVSRTKIKNLKDYIYSELGKIKITPPVSKESLFISEYELYTYTRNKERINVENKLKFILKEMNFEPIQFKYNGLHSLDIKCDRNHIFSSSVQNVISKKIICHICEHEKNGTQYSTKRKSGITFPIKNYKTSILLEKCKSKLINEEFELLSGNMLNGNSVIEVKCINSHNFSSSISNFVRRGCGECSRMNKIKVVTLIESINKKEGKILFQEYHDGEFQFKIQCLNNHIFDTNNINIRNNKWCPDCKTLNRKTKTDKRIQKLNDHLRSIDGVCLDYTPNLENKLKFKCKNNHIFYSNINNVIYGYWCRKCFNLNQSISIPVDRENSIRDYLKSKNGNFVIEPNTFHYKEVVKVKCKREHTWETSIQNLIENQWCRKCGLIERWERTKITIQGINDIIKERGGECLSKEYKNSTKDKLKFICKEGHTWDSIWSNVKKGSWCPTCSKNKRD